VKTATVSTLATMPRVNLLPPEIAERQKVRQVQIGVVAGVAIVAVGVGALAVQGRGGVSKAKDDLAAAQATQTSLQGQLNKLQFVTQTGELRDSAEATLTQATATEIHWSDYLADISVQIPSTMWVTQMTFAENLTPGSLPSPDAAPQQVGSLSIAATSLSSTQPQYVHNGVAAWLDAASKEKGFASPWFSNAQEAFIGSTKVSNFTSTVNLTSDALTKRCAQPGVC
jgi:Tfp pilus assembly protein PilN